MISPKKKKKYIPSPYQISSLLKKENELIKLILCKNINLAEKFKKKGFHVGFLYRKVVFEDFVLKDFLQRGRK